MIDLIGAPFDRCGRRAGSRLGPAALRLANLATSLAEAGCEVEDLGDVPVCEEADDKVGLRGFSAAVETFRGLKEAVVETLEAERIPMILGGDHSLAIGSIAGALTVFGDDLAVLWVDAHVDINTPKTSKSGNLHGMPVAALLAMKSGVKGPSEAQWRLLTDEIVPRPALAPNRIAWLGVRDADRGEREALRRMPDCLPTTMQDIDRFGVDRVVKEFDAWMRGSGATNLWISFDVDALDPILAPGTGTAVRGGLSYREAHLSAELLRDHLDAPDCPYRLVGLDLVETNPLYDSHNETAQLAVEWIA